MYIMPINLAFYTYFYGSEKNNAFKIPNIPSSLTYKCFYYTNNIKLLSLLKKTKWIPIYDNRLSTDDLIQSNMIGKHIKTCPHLYNHLKEYDYLCYLDSKLEHVSEIFVEKYINTYFAHNSTYALLLRNHTFIKPDIWEEYKVSMEQTRYKLQGDAYKKYINKQIESGLSAVTPHHCQCGFLIRNMKHPEINNIGETWLKHIGMCGIQDQISFFFVKQLFSDYILPFKEIPFIITPLDKSVLKNDIYMKKKRSSSNSSSMKMLTI